MLGPPLPAFLRSTLGLLELLLFSIFPLFMFGFVFALLVVDPVFLPEVEFGLRCDTD